MAHHFTQHGKRCVCTNQQDSRSKVRRKEILSQYYTVSCWTQVTRLTSTEQSLACKLLWPVNVVTKGTCVTSDVFIWAALTCRSVWSLCCPGLLSRDTLSRPCWTQVDKYSVIYCPIHARSCCDLLQKTCLCDLRLRRSPSELLWPAIVL